MKNLDTLIHDIYTVLDGLNSDKGVDIPEELMEEFLVNVREALEGWSTPHLQSKTVRMSNVGRPLRRVWYDMQAGDLTAEGMERTVSQSRHVLIFLSDGYFTRPFCLKELRWAILYGCKIVGVVEKDARHGAVDFGREAKLAPADLKHVFAEVEFHPMATLVPRHPPWRVVEQ